MKARPERVATVGQAASPMETPGALHAGSNVLPWVVVLSEVS
jgi:hypothetical protein